MFNAQQQRILANNEGVCRWQNETKFDLLQHIHKINGWIVKKTMPECRSVRLGINLVVWESNVNIQINHYT